MDRTRRRPRRTAPLLDTLESRVLLSASPTGLSPGAVREAYGFDKLSADGRGQTIAIITAYDAPTIAADVDTFDQAFSINNTSSLYTQYGKASSFLTKKVMATRPVANADWAEETALDVEWAHAIAPAAKILLVEAASPYMNDLAAAINYAKKQPSVSVISMSWGGDEFSSQSQYNTLFTTPAGHKGITFIAAAGDDGAVANYPATSPNVVAVGGTSLRLGQGDEYASETAWADSGGGTSRYQTAPAWQTAFSGKRRGSPDVAFVADPNTGVSVYDSYKSDGWMTFGGTSAGAPQWAGLVAIANQLRADAGKSSLDGATQTLPALYAAPASNFHDITSGTAGNRLSAAAGYDLVTGLGSPVADLLIPTLASIPTTPAVKTKAVAGATSTAVATATPLNSRPPLYITPPPGPLPELPSVTSFPAAHPLILTSPVPAFTVTVSV